MSDFKGFSSENQDAVSIPATFFSSLLTAIDDLNELRVSLYAFWYLSGQVSEYRYLLFSEILKDDLFLAVLGSDKETQKNNLTDALERACNRGTLIRAQHENDALYFLNSESGREALDGLLKGKWHPGIDPPFPLRLQKERPNIYALYEENIGPLTPIIAETLQEAENSFSPEWIAEAIKIAVTRNVRHWQYVEAILRTWKEKGRDGTDRKAIEEKRKRDSEGKYADFINH